jgi:hypothetical protein
MVMGLLSTIIQHHRSMLQLIKSAGTADSSWALARDILKGTRYGLWINSCATEEQILQIEQADEFPFSIPEVIKEVEAAYCTDRFFEDLKNRWGTQLYKYSRSDIFQLGRWEIGASSGLHLDDSEIPKFRRQRQSPPFVLWCWLESSLQVKDIRLIANR